jgi:hypothetical protein
MLEPAIDGPLAAIVRWKASELQCCVLGSVSHRITFTSSFSNVAAGLLEFTAMTQVRIRRARTVTPQTHAV